ncbi:hypothetical protein TNCV_2143381 [Trichonephila clavipes]|nr:hypothetical protein TNCV_2143381 [Trichonephila clavipes]
MKRLTFKFVEDNTGTLRNSCTLHLEIWENGTPNAGKQILIDSAGRNGRRLNPILLTAENTRKTSHSKHFQNTGGHTITSRNGRHLYPALLMAGNSRN